MNTENNKLIAEFMGYEVEQDLYGGIPVTGMKTITSTTDTLKFHNNWNWLMEVVEKIESLGYWLNRINGDVWIVNNNDKVIINNSMHQGGIEASYNAVVDFIKWYNIEKQ